MFWLLTRKMRHVLALARVQTTNAVAKGAGLIMNGEKVLPLLAKDEAEAFPDD